MATISDTAPSPSPSPYFLPDPPPLPLRTRVYLHRHGLTHALARGERPATRPELALRAAQLTGSRNRRGLARTLRRTVDDAHRPPANTFRAAVVRRTAVLEAEPEIREMIDRLVSPTEVDAEGMAIADEIVTNANHSPLYNRSEPGTLRRQIRVATEALEPPVAAAA
jgi:hypothetical protein